MRSLMACALGLAIGAVLLGAGGSPAHAGPRRFSTAAALDPEVAKLPGAAGYWLSDPVYKGGKIYVLEVGPDPARSPGAGAGAGAVPPPLFLVHGLGDAGVRDFYPVLAQLARERRVVAFDLPGFGRSTRANERYAPDLYATVLARVIEAFGGEGRVDVLGHSMGGAIAIEHAGHHPAQVRRLVLVDVAGILHREAFVGQQVREATSLAGRLLPRLTELVRDATGAIVEESRRLDPAPQVIVASPLLRKTFLRGEPGRIAALTLILHDFAPALAAITAPALIVWGERDLVAPPRTGVLLVDRLKNAELVTLPGVGHVPMDEAPADLVKHIERHLDAATVTRPPKPPAGKSQGDYRCEGKADQRLRGVYERIVLEGCQRVTLDEVQARELVLRGSRATASLSTITRGVVATGSELVMTGGRVGGKVPLMLEDSRVDLAGVTVEAEVEVYRLEGNSNLIFSVCPTRTPAGLSNTHGIKSSEAPRPRERRE